MNHFTQLLESMNQQYAVTHAERNKRKIIVLVVLMQNTLSSTLACKLFALQEQSRLEGKYSMQGEME